MASAADIVKTLSKSYHVPETEVVAANEALQRAGSDDAVLITDLRIFAEMFGLSPLGLAEYIAANGTHPPRRLKDSPRHRGGKRPPGERKP